MKKGMISLIALVLILGISSAFAATATKATNKATKPAASSIQTSTTTEKGAADSVKTSTPTVKASVVK